MIPQHSWRVYDELVVLLARGTAYAGRLAEFEQRTPECDVPEMLSFLAELGQVTEDLRGIPDAISVETVAGPYDVVVRIEVDDVDLLGKLVVGRVQAVEGITRTLTCPVVSL